MASALQRLLMFCYFFLLSALIGSSIPTKTHAEPWLGSRFARNCSGCHAPQRINLPPKDRRCSLSCQGCHVNPNGGGLRSFYGKWTENRWLKSFRSDRIKNDLNIATYPKQIYAKKKNLWTKTSDALVFGTGLPLVETRKKMDENKYYWQYGRYKTMAKNRKHYLFQIPAKDPWRQMRLTKWDGGADARWFVMSMQTKADGKKGKRWANFPMSVDFSLRYRPFYRKFHLVYENRMYGSPSKGFTKEAMLSSATTRSLYALLDDMPYNVFVMGGHYRPLFGNYDPYHYGLAQKMFSYTLQGNARAYNIAYEAVSIGTAPNVPYLNLHKIGKRIGGIDDRNSGYVVNVGFRGVRYGQSLNYSFWSSEDTATKTRIQMHSIGAFFYKAPLTLSYEGMSFARDSADDFRQGGVHTLEGYYQFWRELYGQLTLATANVSQDLLPGNSRQIRLGVKAFLIPGLEVGLHLENNENKNSARNRKDSSSGIAGNLHAYF